MRVSRWPVTGRGLLFDRQRDKVDRNGLTTRCSVGCAVHLRALSGAASARGHALRASPRGLGPAPCFLKGNTFSGWVDPKGGEAWIQ